MARCAATSAPPGASPLTSRSPKDIMNRLAQEQSPYLLQHADNPVDWRPWGSDAFDAAVRLDRPIFLSIGYSTCHWCHVMAHESFESPEIGSLLNEHFIPIKVDREERPDVDRVYMTFVQATTGSGGWPMSVWLTPDLKPALMVAKTLQAMAFGGMRDHIGGGFHRYSVDRNWRVPHFEKMLYDQAQITLACLETHQVAGDVFFADIAEDTLQYVQREMTSPEGGFFSAEDADSLPPEMADDPHAHKMEGAFYLWTENELNEL